MSERLARFLISLSENPYKVDKLRADPDSVLADADLTPEEKAAVRSGNAGEIERMLGGLQQFSTSSTANWSNWPQSKPPNWTGKPPGGGNKKGP